jgi:NAD(P)-dependent dehydrogenase (short-subunit alcohol dehydrogenase family)
MVRTVLVTGANSGLGLATCLHLSGLGFRVVGTGRSEEKLDLLQKAAGDAGLEVEGALLDVTDGRACERVVAAVEPWGLVNNAGYMNVGRVVDVTPEEALRQLETLVVAPMRLATLAVPGMRRRGSGRIVNVSSAIAHGTSAMTGWYQASKHALSAVTDAFRKEVAEDGIDVVLVEPGGLDTGIWDKAEDDLARRREGAGDATPYDRALRLLRTGRPYMPGPEIAAEAIGRALTAGRPRVRYSVGLDAPFVRVGERLLPDRAQDRLARMAMGR